MSSSTHTPSSAKSDFTALTLWLNREREAFPQLMKKGVESEFSTPKMPGHYSSSTTCERKRKSLGSEMGFYEVMITEGGQEAATSFGEIEFESFEASGVLALSPDVSIEQENSVRQIIVVEMEEEEEVDDQAEQYEHGLSQIQEEECGHFLDPVEEVTEEPTIVEWEVEEEEQQQQQSLVHTSTPKRIQSSSITSNKLHDWARLHGLGTPSSFAPSPITTASRFGWAEVIAQTRLEELEERRSSNNNNNSVVTTIFSPFSPAKAMGFTHNNFLRKKVYQMIH